MVGVNDTRSGPTSYILFNFNWLLPHKESIIMRNPSHTPFILYFISFYFTYAVSISSIVNISYGDVIVLHITCNCLYNCFIVLPVFCFGFGFGWLWSACIAQSVIWCVCCVLLWKKQKLIKTLITKKDQKAAGCTEAASGWTAGIQL